MLQADTIGHRHAFAADPRDSLSSERMRRVSRRTCSETSLHVHSIVLFPTGVSRAKACGCFLRVARRRADNIVLGISLVGRQALSHLRYFKTGSSEEQEWCLCRAGAMYGP